MNIKHLSASSIETFKMCQYSYMLRYTYGLKGFLNSGALKGTVCHSVFEDIAADMINGESPSRGKINDYLVKHFEKIRDKSKHELLLTSEDFADCKKMIDGVIAKKAYGYFNRNILGIEKEFDLVFDKTGELILSNAKEECDKNDIDIEAYMDAMSDCFRVYGFIDLVTEQDKDTCEILDWKTGKSMKSYDKLKNDTQLKMYSMVANNIYDGYKDVLVSIWYLRSRLYTLCFDKKELDNFAGELYNIWNKIKSCKRPKRNINTKVNGWKCKFCAFKCGKQECDVFYEAESLGKDVSAYVNEIKNGRSIL